MPITAFIGVRISCDMLARKFDLCWLSRSACRRASSSSALSVISWEFASR